MKEVFILIQTSKSDFVIDAWKKNGIHSEIIFKDVNIMLRVLRKIWLICKIPFFNIWYNNWKEKVKRAKLIVVHVSALTTHLCSYINKLNPNAEVVAWYWNPVEAPVSCIPEKIKGNCSKWSFDPIDCKKYKLNFNHQYYFKSLIIEKKEIMYDIYFVGADKGRGKVLIEIYQACLEQNIVPKFQVVNPLNKLIPSEICCSFVPYDEVRNNIAASTAILEIIQPNQNGVTLRTMEALFFGKKLVTNNVLIEQEEFFNESNIFIIGKRPLSELREFLNGKFIEYPRELLDKYDVKQWIANFNLNEQGEIKC